MFDLIIGIVIGAALSPLWVKIGSYLWSLFSSKEPTVASDVAEAATVVGDVAAPVVATVEAKVPAVK